MSKINKADESLRSLVSSSNVIVVLGSGGVGKTTSSISLAINAAILGKKVGLLSIDPAKRLADALGITLGSELVKINLGKSELKGEIYGAMLDQKAVFDEMVKRFAKSDAVRDKIFQNSLYQQVSTNLGGPLEYVALAKLQRMAELGQFDLIVLDTPPDTHALDFLMRPNILSGFMEKGVITWLIKPFAFAQKLGAGRLLKMGGRLMSGISAITGVKMLQMLSEFLVLMEDVIKGFGKAGEQVSDLLRRPSTKFMVVAAPHNAAVRSVDNLLQQLSDESYPLGAMIINRCFPAEMKRSLEVWQSNRDKYQDYEGGLNILNSSLLSSEGLEKKLIDNAREYFGGDLPIFKIEEQKEMIHSVEHIYNFSETVGNSIALKNDILN